MNRRKAMFSRPVKVTAEEYSDTFQEMANNSFRPGVIRVHSSVPPITGVITKQEDKVPSSCRNQMRSTLENGQQDYRYCQRTETQSNNVSETSVGSGSFARQNQTSGGSLINSNVTNENRYPVPPPAHVHHVNTSAKPPEKTGSKLSSQFTYPPPNFQPQQHHHGGWNMNTLPPNGNNNNKYRNNGIPQATSSGSNKEMTYNDHIYHNNSSCRSAGTKSENARQVPQNPPQQWMQQKQNQPLTVSNPWSAPSHFVINNLPHPLPCGTPAPNPDQKQIKNHANSNSMTHGYYPVQNAGNISQFQNHGNGFGCAAQIGHQGNIPVIGNNVNHTTISYCGNSSYYGQQGQQLTAQSQMQHMNVHSHMQKMNVQGQVQQMTAQSQAHQMNVQAQMQQMNAQSHMQQMNIQAQMQRSKSFELQQQIASSHQNQAKQNNQGYNFQEQSQHCHHPAPTTPTIPDYNPQLYPGPFCYPALMPLPWGRGYAQQMPYGQHPHLGYNPDAVQMASLYRTPPLPPPPPTSRGRGSRGRGRGRGRSIISNAERCLVKIGSNHLPESFQQQSSFEFVPVDQPTKKRKTKASNKENDKGDNITMDLATMNDGIHQQNNIDPRSALEEYNRFNGVISYSNDNNLSTAMCSVRDFERIKQLYCNRPYNINSVVSLQPLEVTAIENPMETLQILEAFVMCPDPVAEFGLVSFNVFVPSLTKLENYLLAQQKVAESLPEPYCFEVTNNIASLQAMAACFIKRYIMSYSKTSLPAPALTPDCFIRLRTAFAEYLCKYGMMMIFYTQQNRSIPHSVPEVTNEPPMIDENEPLNLSKSQPAPIIDAYTQQLINQLPENTELVAVTNVTNTKSEEDKKKENQLQTMCQYNLPNNEEFFVSKRETLSPLSLKEEKLRDQLIQFAPQYQCLTTTPLKDLTEQSQVLQPLQEIVKQETLIQNQGEFKQETFVQHQDKDQNQILPSFSSFGSYLQDVSEINTITAYNAAVSLESYIPEAQSVSHPTYILPALGSRQSPAAAATAPVIKSESQCDVNEYKAIHLNVEQKSASKRRRHDKSHDYTSSMISNNSTLSSHSPTTALSHQMITWDQLSHNSNVKQLPLYSSNALHGNQNQISFDTNHAQPKTRKSTRSTRNSKK